MPIHNFSSWPALIRGAGGGRELTGTDMELEKETALLYFDFGFFKANIWSLAYVLGFWQTLIYTLIKF